MASGQVDRFGAQPQPARGELGWDGLACAGSACFSWNRHVGAGCWPPVDLSTPQAIKVCSAGFKQLTDEERHRKQATLLRHWWVLAHALQLAAAAKLISGM